MSNLGYFSLKVVEAENDLRGVARKLAAMPPGTPRFQKLKARMEQLKLDRADARKNLEDFKLTRTDH